MGVPCLGLLLVNEAYAHRSARADLDFGLAAAALDFDLRVYFLGSAVTQLVQELNPAAACLPAGYRAWSALSDLGDARLFAEQSWLERCARSGLRLLAPVQGLDEVELREHWRSCDLTLALQGHG